MTVYLRKKKTIDRDTYFSKYYKDGVMDKSAPLVINVEGLLVKVEDLPSLALNHKSEVSKYCYGLKKRIPEYIPFITFVWENNKNV